jgi:hypothetical protein
MPANQQVVFMHGQPHIVNLDERQAEDLRKTGKFKLTAQQLRAIRAKCQIWGWL